MTDASGTTTYTYDNASNVATVTYPNGQQATLGYDQENRLTGATAGTMAGYSYALGPTGIKTGATEQSGRAVTRSFDGIYPLTGETVTGDQHYNGSVGYTLDPVGNRLPIDGAARFSTVVDPVDCWRVPGYHRIVSCGGREVPREGGGRLGAN